MNSEHKATLEVKKESKNKNMELEISVTGPSFKIDLVKNYI